MAKSKKNKRLNKKNASRREIKKKAVELKGGKCEVCDYNKCLAALTFHHINPAEKNFGISDKGHEYGIDAVIKEIKLTILLCNRCHVEYHEGLLDLSKFIKKPEND